MDRSCALTYANVRKMYDNVYQCMVEAGVAKKLDVASDQFPDKLKMTHQLIKGKRRLDMMIDSPAILPTDIIPIVNYAWERSFVKVDNNKKAITARGWGPLNYNLLINSQIQPTTSNSEMIHRRSLLKIQLDSSFANQQSSTTSDTLVMINSSSLSDLTNDDLVMNYIHSSYNRYQTQSQC